MFRYIQLTLEHNPSQQLAVNAFESGIPEWSTVFYYIIELKVEICFEHDPQER